MIESAPTADAQPTIDRRHDLDALRAIAMLLGILIHGLLSFVPMPKGAWPVQDDNASEAFGVVLSAIHGFRMPLFFLISGFFTAMLWRKRGLRSLLRHRFKRIFLPLLIGMFTIIPVTWAAIIGISMATAGDQPTLQPMDLFTVSTPEQADRILANASEPIDLEKLDSTFQMPAITHAVLANHPELIGWFVEQGADVDTATGDGSTAINIATFLGREQCAKVLISAGADVTVRNRDGNGIGESLKAPWMLTNSMAKMLGVELKREELEAGRKGISGMIDWDAVRSANKKPKAARDSETKLSKDRVVAALLYWGMIPVFHHLWFLWFLCWLVVAFILYAAILRKTGRDRFPDVLVVSPWRYAWLIPLTILPQMLMGLMYPNFGPDTSSGPVPLPQVLFYYAIFFFFGAMYFDSKDSSGKLGNQWKWTLPIALLVVFPIGYVVTMGKPGNEWIEPSWHRSVSVVTQVIYVWLMTFGLVGFFRSVFRGENKTMRYISDSSYWLYLAHLPAIMLAQYIVRHWQLPAIVKCGVVCVIVSGLLLLSYQIFVRYTPIGTLLNGPRQRSPKRIAETANVMTET
jgi:peptidoglycan/LPS O-acetylase OafA/YrhL